MDGARANTYSIVLGVAWPLSKEDPASQSYEGKDVELGNGCESFSGEEIYAACEPEIEEGDDTLEKQCLGG
jgi:hypothetical protein